jgi:hypothetical protein
VSACYRREVFTRTRGQLSLDAMFVSITKSRVIFQENDTTVAIPELGLRVGRLLIEWDATERPQTNTSPNTDVIDDNERAFIGNLNFLADKSESSRVVSRNLTEEDSFDPDNANKPPTVSQVAPSRTNTPRLVLRQAA